MKRKYLLVIENAGENLSAYFPDVPGAVTTGRTVEEVLAHAAEALSLHLEEEDEAPAARSLAQIAGSADVGLDGTEVLAWLDYEHGKAHAPA